MPVFDRSNVNLARQFMQGPRPRPDSPYGGRYPHMQSFSQTPMGQELMARVLRSMQGRQRGTARPKRRPAALEGNR